MFLKRIIFVKSLSQLAADVSDVNCVDVDLVFVV